jgi:hypothetical protein
MLSRALGFAGAGFGDAAGLAALAGEPPPSRHPSASPRRPRCRRPVLVGTRRVRCPSALGASVVLLLLILDGGHWIGAAVVGLHR